MHLIYGYDLDSNIKIYVMRRVKERFLDAAKSSGSMQAKEQYAEGLKDLELIQRFSTISSLYSGQGGKSVF